MTEYGQENLSPHVTAVRSHVPFRSHASVDIHQEFKKNFPYTEKLSQQTFECNLGKVYYILLCLLYVVQVEHIWTL